jgi:transcriptional regulator with XRE-family HTH domain
MKEDKNRKAFGKRLQTLRKQKRLTQKEAAAKIQSALSQYNKYEYGLNYPTTEKLLLLANLYNTTTDYLLTGNVSEKNPLINLRLLKRFEELEKLNIDEQETAIKILDAIITQNKVKGAISPLDKE